MSSKTNRLAGAGLLSAIAASSCCIPPVIAAIAGVGGISSSLSWMEPLRPFLIGLAIVAIGYSWYVHLKPKKADDCGCDIQDKPKWYQTRGFLVGITLFAAISIAFPYYSGVFFSDNSANKTIVVESTNLVEGTLTIKGMTCTGCEHHVNQTLNDSEGVIETSSSYENGVATVKFDKTKTSIDKLATAVEEATGYKVTETHINVK